MSVTDARATFSDVVERSHTETVIVERRGRAEAVVVSPERYERMMDALEEVEDFQAFDAAMAEGARTSSIDLLEIVGTATDNTGREILLRQQRLILSEKGHAVEEDAADLRILEPGRRTAKIVLNPLPKPLERHHAIRRPSRCQTSLIRIRANPENRPTPTMRLLNAGWERST
ncbi:type II toxin-antitoxin system Phd/YefM family antitoxin [Rathayibacter tanaceti]|uniref:type II toxin-antitoxin system Phd/YefM family antitoxin n=1 Tax=Rathayibacter tanaceti TaxID=1671680 RepID=UPI0022A9BF78|nr:type II toxin-antitoxin system Phd/YefM family antitoxin [Rathayibacter tanaceti]